MKKSFVLIVMLLLLSCNKNDNLTNCNFLLNVGVSLDVNLNLPQYNQLMFPSNGLRVEGQGNNGIILWRLNSSTLLAWDGSDPNHTATSCSRLTINGERGQCGCDDANEYSLSTGQSLNAGQPCTLKPYRVESLGNNRYLVSN